MIEKLKNKSVPYPAEALAVALSEAWRKINELIEAHDTLEAENKELRHLWIKEAWDWKQTVNDYTVLPKRGGKFAKDELRAYRHFPLARIEALRAKK